jgi:DNA-3-methyladenine glycosylase
MVCQGLAVDRALDGLDLTLGEGLWLASGPARESAVGDIASGPRIGVDYAGEWAARRWRFWLAGHPSVSHRVPPR